MTRFFAHPSRPTSAFSRPGYAGFDLHLRSKHALLGAASAGILTLLAACSPASDGAETAQVEAEAPETTATINAANWPRIEPLPLDPAVEARVESILATMTLEQKVGQVIQADSGSVTPEDVRDYHLGSVLSGGNSAPGPLPYADTQTWLEAADAYYQASLEQEGVEVSIPIIWGIDAVHGHANLIGATVFPHNVGLGAARNPDLIEEISRVTARELSVSGHDWTFAPTLAVPQDDRWGRGYEGFSENPEVVASYAPRIVEGLQGTFGGDDFMGVGSVISSAKHYLGDGGTLEGRDQGDAVISEAELRDVHGAGYFTAIPAGVQTVMASFSSWQGQRMHGQQELLTDVLKEQMGFNGFVVGDWNGHGTLPGCTPTDCPQSLNAGLDMYMAPDSWRGLYESTLRHVQEGTIPMERLDDAVRRILRVKIAAGIFERGLPSSRPLAGDTSILGSPEHRAIARQAVRESLVLLKNNDQLLPLDPGLRVLVIGDGADSISKASGGWTLSWQGGGIENSEFPNGQTILDGIRETVEAAGGTVVFDRNGDNADIEADVVIAVYGEDPYAEFQGDRDHVDFVPNGFDPAALDRFSDAGLPVVSVFLSGRPLWSNPEINASDAFIAAWLPGSEGGGVADLLFDADDGFDFTGTLSFSWPRTALDSVLNVGSADYDPLFPFGYGLAYGDDGNLPDLPEESGLSASDASDASLLFAQGQANAPWTLSLSDGDASEAVTELPAMLGSAELLATDRTSQEDSLRLVWSEAGARVSLVRPEPADLERQSNGAMELSFQARAVGSDPVPVNIGMGCATSSDCEATVPVTLISGPWREYRVSLACFADQGVDMRSITTGLFLEGAGPVGDITLGDIRLDSDTDAARDCGDAG
jgi:beta-glucosidase